MPIFADNWSASPMAYQGLGDRRAGFTTPPPQARAEPAYAPPPESRSFPLGVARGQVAKTYIVAEAGDGLVLVDQQARTSAVEGKRVSVRVDLGGRRILKK